jgi:glyoxylase-like metal-dependent hydrolase (beta-lactamase superfamily II)
MRLYLFECARLVVPDENCLGKKNTADYKLVIPVPVSLLVHPTEGLVLFDTGVERDHWPDEVKLGVCTSPLLRIDAHLRRLGYETSRVRHIVMSHLHADHAGQMALFPDALFHMRKSEWEEATQQPRGDYFSADFAPARGFRFTWIPEDIDYDLFGDGSVVCVDTKGHTPGHQSFLINLPATGKLLFAVDAAHLPDYLSRTDYFDGSWNKALCMRAVERLKELRAQGAQLIFGHDPSQWAVLRKAPNFYD